jgi:hypothetical protein
MLFSEHNNVRLTGEPDASFDPVISADAVYGLVKTTKRQLLLLVVAEPVIRHKPGVSDWAASQSETLLKFLISAQTDCDGSFSISAPPSRFLLPIRGFRFGDCLHLLEFLFSL